MTSQERCGVDLVVPPSGRLTATTIAEAVTRSSAEVCRVDLRNATFVEPVGLVAIASVVERAVREGRTVEVVSPTNSDCRNYLCRMQVGAVLGEMGVPHDLTAVRSHALTDRLQELRRFGSEEELDDVAETIINLYRRAGLTVVQPLYQTLYELAVNAVQHSGQDGGFVALQSFPRGGDVAFAIADSGRGLRARLSESMAVPSDAVAIQLAARKHVSATDAPGRGRGITGVIELTGAHSGAVTMISGQAQGIFTRGHWDPRVTGMEAPFLGTLAQARLALERRLDLLLARFFPL